MLLKFFRHGTKGGSVEYVLAIEVTDPETGERIRRSVPPRVLRGNPEFVRQLYESLAYSHKYTSGVLSFSEASIPDSTLQEIMDGFEEQVYAGLPDEQHLGCWVLHLDKGRVELHFILPNCVIGADGQTRSFTPYVHGHRTHGKGRSDLTLFDAWKNSINARYGFSDPNDPARSRSLAPSPNLPRPVLMTAQDIDGFVTQHIQQGLLQNRDDVIALLVEAGFTLNRKGKEYISVRADDLAKPIRLKGAFYGESFRNIECLGPRTSAGSGQNPTAPAGTGSATDEPEAKLARLSEFRRLRHQARYGEFLQPAPEPYQSVEPGNDGDIGSADGGLPQGNRTSPCDRIGEHSAAIQGIADSNPDASKKSISSGVDDTGGGGRLDDDRNRDHGLDAEPDYHHSGFPLPEPGWPDLYAGDPGPGREVDLIQGSGDGEILDRSPDAGRFTGKPGQGVPVIDGHDNRRTPNDGTGNPIAEFLAGLGRRIQGARGAFAAAIERIERSIGGLDGASRSLGAAIGRVEQRAPQFGQAVERFGKAHRELDAARRAHDGAAQLNDRDMGR
jgi:hypothetical protein